MNRATWIFFALTLPLCACGGGDTPSDAQRGDVGADLTEQSDLAQSDLEQGDTDQGDAAPDLPQEQTYALGDLEVVVSQSITLKQGARVLTSLSPSPIRALTYQEQALGPAAIWNFTRTQEQRHVFEGAPQVQEGAGALHLLWEGAQITLEPGPTPHSTRLLVQVESVDYDSLQIAFGCHLASSFAGFGEQYNAVEQRGETFELLVSEQGIGRTGRGAGRLILGDAHTTYFPMPWWVDLAQGSGVLAQTSHRAVVDLCATDPQEATVEITGGQPASFLVFHGPTALDVIEQLSQVVGRPRTPPPWAFGAPWISAQGGTEAVRAVIDQLEQHQVPYGAIWSQDWTGVRTNLDGGLGVQYRWEADQGHYPGLRQLADDLHADGKKFLGYANPFIDPNLPNHFEALDQRGLLIGDQAGQSYVFSAPNGTSSHPDLTQEAARAYVEQALAAMVQEHGFDGWMADFAEWTPLDATFADGTDPAAAHNLYPVWWHRSNRAALEAVRPDGDWVTIARSGWTGVQAHSMIHWVGDQEATWEAEDGLPTVVPAMLTLGLSGVPYVTLDIGGFSGGPSTRELYMRWVELGAFAPIMRTHEGNRRDENHNWNSDQETIDHFRRFARIHLALGPLWTQLAQEASQTSAPMVRALALHHPSDPQARAISDQFLLGPDLLVAPVVQEGATSREVYLPQGQWFHVFTGQPYQGPGWFMVDAPIGSPPVFSLGQDRQDLRALD